MKKLLLSTLFITALSVFAADVHIDKNADRGVKFAAKDLARCLSIVTGKTYTCKESAAAQKAGDIIIVDDSKLEKQQWSLVTRDGKLYISGRSAPGMVYGVYAFLEKYADCLWPAPDTEVIPKNPNWKLPTVNEKGKPAIARREFYVALPAPDGLWRMRNKENYRAAFGLNMRVGSPNDTHSFDFYVKAVKALNDPSLFGPRISGGKCGTLCMTNPKVREIILAEVLKYIKADREKVKNQPKYAVPTIYDLSQPDGPSGGECWCEGCKALALKEGSYSGPNLDFVNYIARGVKAKYPDVIIQTFAYSYTQKPPKTIKAEDNVMIRYCDAQLYHPLVAGTPNAKELEEWNKYASKKSIWSYWRIFDGYLYPFVKTRKDIAGEMLLCKKDGVYSYFGENEAMLSRSFAIQQHFLGMKMLDDPTQDIYKLNDRFMRAYYGKAAPFMMKYLEYLEKHQEVTRSFLNKEFFEKVNGWLDEAEKAVKDDKKSLQHVQCERVIVDRTMFLRINELLKEGYKVNIKAVADRFRKNGVMHIQTWRSMDSKPRRDLITQLNGEADLYSHFPVPIPKQFQNCEVIDLHWNQLQRSTANAVKDPDAVCGMAIRNPKAPMTLPWSMGFYSVALREGNSIRLLQEDIPTDEKFHWYNLGKTLILAPLYIHYDKAWHFRGWLSSIGILGERREIWISAKFQGKNFVKGSTKPNAVLFDRMLLVKVPEPLISNYKPITKASMIKNGSFEQYNNRWINNWCKIDKFIKVDTVNKKHGKAALRLDGENNANVKVMISLGEIANMNNDLLIRGWYKYSDIDRTRKQGSAFVGLWPQAKNGSNTSYSQGFFEIYNGSSDWKYFEKIVDIEKLKKATAKSTPFPGHRLYLRAGLYKMPGTIWLDNIEIIPLEKK